MPPGIEFYRTEQCLWVYVSYLSMGFLDIRIKTHQGQHRQEHLWLLCLLSNGDGNCITFHRLTAYTTSFLVSYVDATLTTGIALGTDTLWLSSEIFFTRHLTEFMIKMISGSKKHIFSKDQLYARAGMCVYGHYAPANLRPALINGTVSVLFKKRCQSVLSVISDYFCVFVCLFLHRFIKSFKGSFLATFLEIRYQHWRYGGVGSVSFLAEEAENWEFL